MPETIQLFGSAKTIKEKTKNGENLSTLEVNEVLLEQCNLVDNHYHEKYKVLYIFMRNKSIATF